MLVDANVLLDVLTDDPLWGASSSEKLDACAGESELCINPIIYAEVFVGFERIEEVGGALTPDAFTWLELPWEVGFLAGKAFLAYRRARASGLHCFRTSASVPMPLLMAWRCRRAMSRAIAGTTRGSS